MRISIIIPAYNNGPELKECLQAVVPAAGDDVEIIVVDDGSTDESAAAVDAMGVRVVRLPHNVGPAAARNEGAAAAEGEVLVFLDADVVASPAAIERVRTLFEHDAGIPIHTPVDEIDDIGLLLERTLSDGASLFVRWYLCTQTRRDSRHLRCATMVK